MSAHVLRWLLQVKKIVGHAAPEAFTLAVESLAVEHHAQLIVDCTRAYHFGTRFNVELEVILPADMTVRDPQPACHGIGL